MTEFIQEKFPKNPTLKLQINKSNKQNDSSKKGNLIKINLDSMGKRPSNLDALIDKKLAEKKASIAAAKKASLTTGKK